ncbi:hypothetical protein [Actinomadura rugatobispora]|uniref:WXG100 family type VII secretion target n=1 Tax=Actinomadura rugatobispora TaxID=1994 RepID=A0ABW1AED6_9ACTN|nr:hypothetical protein GCM10010200_033860 [Actinomadura rugatobispora]
MGAEFIGLTQGGALGQGGDQLSAEARNLLAQVQTLGADMERAGEAIQGAGLSSLNGAIGELMTRCGELIRWCDQNGVKLVTANNDVGQTVTQTVDDFSAAKGQFTSLERPITA